MLNQNLNHHWKFKRILHEFLSNFSVISSKKVKNQFPMELVWILPKIYMAGKWMSQCVSSMTYLSRQVYFRLLTTEAQFSLFLSDPGATCHQHKFQMVFFYGKLHRNLSYFSPNLAVVKVDLLCYIVFFTFLLKWTYFP